MDNIDIFYLLCALNLFPLSWKVSPEMIFLSYKYKIINYAIKDLVNKKVTLIFVVNLSSRTKAKESFQIYLHNLEILEEIKNNSIHNCMEFFYWLPTK